MEFEVELAMEWTDNHIYLQGLDSRVHLGDAKNRSLARSLARNLDEIEVICLTFSWTW